MQLKINLLAGPRPLGHALSTGEICISYFISEPNIPHPWGSTQKETAVLSGVQISARQALRLYSSLRDTSKVC